MNVCNIKWQSKYMKTVWKLCDDKLLARMIYQLLDQNASDCIFKRAGTH